MAAIYSNTSGAPTGNVYLDTLVWGGAWTPTLKQGVTLNWLPLTSGGGFAGIAWTGDDLAALQSALQTWSNVANVRFVSDASRPVDIAYYKVDSATMDTLTGTTGVLGFHDVPDGSNSVPLRGVFNADAMTPSNLLSGADGFVTLVHEIGHGLGLAHPHDGGGNGTTFPGVGSWNDLGDDQRNQQVFTIMSYNVGWDQQPASNAPLSGETKGPMALDIAAVQALYGPNTTFNNGVQTYQLPQADVSGTGWNCIWDTGGTDTLSNSGSALACRIDLRDAPLSGTDAGGYVSWAGGVPGGFTIANGVVIENAVGGSGNDQITGNDVANDLDGGTGADTLTGGKGNDTYRVDNVGDTVTESDGTTAGGIDQVVSTVSYVLPANVENLSLSGSADVDATGNSLKNVITGNAGANLLFGDAGADELTGGAGNDTYHVDFSVLSGRVVLQDKITELAGGGTDNLILRQETPMVLTSAATVSLPAEVERIDISSTGTTLLNLIGSSVSNILIGNAAANTLDGGGGEDSLAGGAGDDIYIVESGNDQITEMQSAGIDRVRSSARSYTLPDNVEHITLTDNSAVEATGNDLDNEMTGNISANTLTGAGGNDVLDGGTGVDNLTGGAGDDTYVIDTKDDVIVELAGEGHDTVRSSVTYTLATNLEDLVLIGGNAINATGNALDNTLTGNNNRNILDGGAGADAMAGGRGNDTYVVDNSGDTITESEGGTLGGIDLIQSSITYALGTNQENLTLTGSTAIDATGNALANTLVGNSAGNFLDGAGGYDILRGGQGDDTYRVDLIRFGTGARLEDLVVEALASGDDSVLVEAGTDLGLTSSARLVVGANIERFDISGTGSNRLDVTGNALANTLTGNDAANVLDGGASSDTLTGGAGDDTYVVDATTDAVIEAALAGLDTVKSSALLYALPANVENLTLTGTGANRGTGNGLDNLLTGNAAANTLDGDLGNDRLYGGQGGDTLLGGSGDDWLYGGLGRDRLTGGDGVDRFVFDTRPNTSNNLDTVNDFSVADDKIVIDKDIFTALRNLGAIGPDNLAYGARAQDADDYLVYNTGTLMYDADGNGAAASIAVAVLIGAPAITYGNLELI